MEESEIKDILLALVEPNRNRPSDSIPADVKGWRFPSTTSSSAQPDGGDDDDQYNQPVCFWTGISCDPIDGSVTGLNLGNGFYAKKLLGIAEDAAAPDGARLLHHDEKAPVGNEFSLYKMRYPDPPPEHTKQRRADEVSYTSFSMSFPSSIGRLLSLRFVNLSGNSLRGPIPTSVLQLPNLEIFDASMNDLEGRFPHFSSDALRVLDISKNRFHGPLGRNLFAHPNVGPFTAPYLESIVKFDISHNGFNGTIPLDGTSGLYNPETEYDEAFRNLQYFDLGFNLFSGTICNNFAHMDKLQGLFLEHNRLVGTIPKAIYRGSGLGANPLPLVQLFLQQNSLSGTLHEGLATLPDLRELYVDGNKLTGEVPESLCESELNNMFLNNTEAARGCDGISCPVNSASREGVAPCTPCPEDGGFNRYMGQHAGCRGSMSEEEILDLFFEQTHGEEWLDSAYLWEKGSPACERKGIECNDRGQVAKIILPSLGVRGAITPELGYLSSLHALVLPGNELTGFLPSDLRFAPLRHLDVRGSRLEGVVPPLLCIKEGVNGNGIGPPGIDFNLLYACENIVCPRGTYSSIGRAAIPESEGEDGIQCMPCYDDQARFYMGRDKCTDIRVAGFQVRREDVRRVLIKAIPIIIALVILATLSWRQRRKTMATAANRRGSDDNEARRSGGNAEARRNSRNENNEGRVSWRQNSGLQRWVSTSRIEDEEEDEDSDDDWTAGYSEAGGDETRHIHVSDSIEMPRRNPRVPDMI